MNEKAITDSAVPGNVKGKPVDLDTSVTELSVEEAVHTFQKACKKILNPAVWHKLAGAASASFKLVSHDDVIQNRRRMECIDTRLSSKKYRG